MTPEYSEFLAHYGVKGQKWGTRQWQNYDGSYTEAGKQHYGWGYGRQQTAGTQQSTGIRSMPSQRRTTIARTARNNVVRQRQQTQAEIEARKARTQTILKIAAGVAVAAAVGYATYKGSTKLRDNMRSDVYKNINTDSRNLHTLNSKYWDSADRKKYSELSAKRADDIANSITRREALAAKVSEKTGIKVSLPQGREKVMAQRRSENAYANFIRDAEKRGAMNRSIHDARESLRKQQSDLNRYRSTTKIGVSKQYESANIQRREEQIDEARQRLNSLLQMRRAG